MDQDYILIRSRTREVKEIRDFQVLSATDEDVARLKTLMRNRARLSLTNRRFQK
jgi:hypothetical protein